MQRKSGNTHSRPSTRMRTAHVAVAALLVAAVGCSPAPQVSPPAADVGSGWRDFEGTWTAAGNREVIALGSARKASVSILRGSLLLSGPERPALGVRAEVVVFNDSATGMIGRAVWTDDRGDQAWSELRGEGTATGNRISGTFIGGTGRFAGIAGDYTFTWRFVLETEDGTVQGQSVGLKGRVRVGQAAGDRQ
jgi:hypothetical protein